MIIQKQIVKIITPIPITEGGKTFTIWWGIKGEVFVISQTAHGLVIQRLFVYFLTLSITLILSAFSTILNEKAAKH